MYWQRWRSFLRAVEPHRARLARQVDALTLAESRLMPAAPAALDPGQRETRILARVAAMVRRYWRSRPCAAWAGARLPKIVAGPYFETGADAVHFLDLAPQLIAQALTPERPGREGPAQGRRHRRHLARGAEMLLVDELREQLLDDPVAAVAGPLFQPVIAALTALAHNGASQATRRVAAGRLAVLFRAVCPDFRTRSHRPRLLRCRLRVRSRERGDRLAWLTEVIREEQANFAAACAGNDRAALPPPLRAARSFDLRAGPAEAARMLEITPTARVARRGGD